MQLLRSMQDIRGRQVLFVNDCLPVIQAMKKGSGSEHLQRDAEYMAVAGLEAGAALLFLHVPGTRMIEEGVDGASREGAKRIIGATCTARARATIKALLKRNNWEISIDLFAANCNKMTGRFASWTDEPGSEVVDAFTIPSWNQSVCQCGSSHRETFFIFPPVGLERATVKRARSDGARCVFVVPTAYKSGYWMALRNHSIDRAELTRPDLDFTNVQGTLGKHTVFLVDFGTADSLSPACGQARAPRGRRPLLGNVEREERARVQEELRRLSAEIRSCREVQASAAAADEQRRPSVASGDRDEPVPGTEVELS